MSDSYDEYVRFVAEGLADTAVCLETDGKAAVINVLRAAITRLDAIPDVQGIAIGVFTSDKVMPGGCGDARAVALAAATVSDVFAAVAKAEEPQNRQARRAARKRAN